jgi:hypothetical protein
LWFATIQCIESKQDLAGLAPKERFIPAKPVERVAGQIGQTQKATCEVARKIAGDAPGMVILECARDAAQAELDLAQIGRVKVALIERMSAFGELEAPNSELAFIALRSCQPGYRCGKLQFCELRPNRRSTVSASAALGYICGIV